MKKLMTLMLGLSFLAGTVTVVLAQETKTETKKAPKKGEGKKKTEEPKKGGQF